MQLQVLVTYGSCETKVELLKFLCGRLLHYVDMKCRHCVRMISAELKHSTFDAFEGSHDMRERIVKEINMCCMS